jgi:potassium uptake TrkH family protein
MVRFSTVRKVADVILLTVAFFSVVSILILYGFFINIYQTVLLLRLEHVFALIFIFGLSANILNSKSKKTFIKKNFIQILLTFIFFVVDLFETYNILTSPHGFEINRNAYSRDEFFIIFLHIFLIISSFVAITKYRDIWLIFPLRASRILVLSFFFVIAAGTLLLKLPKANVGLSWIDAFFTATSAVCVTGLSTVDISQTLTFEGQFILMGLIQIGGLGIVTLTTFVAIFLSQGFRLKDQVILSEIMDDQSSNSISTTLIKIIGLTFTIEIIGAFAFYVSWLNFDFNTFERIFYSLFHSVSAYCNAGFSNYSGGFENPMFSNHFSTLIILMILIILGGLGFYTMTYIFFRKKNFYSQGLQLQTKIILITSGVLIVGGSILIFILQHNAWADLPLKNQIMNSVFLSVTSRTAGFSNVNVGTVLVPTLMIVVFLMYVGAAPNSTGGGIKITTFVTLVFGVWAFIRGKDKVEIGWNTINMIVVRRSLIVFFISISLISVSVFILSITENYIIVGNQRSDIFSLFFETVSAFGTVGLSRGITPFLSEIGKFVLIVVMFFGRVGLFTLAIAIGEEKYHTKYKYPETNIMVG